MNLYYFYSIWLYFLWCWLCVLRLCNWVGCSSYDGCVGRLHWCVLVLVARCAREWNAESSRSRQSHTGSDCEGNGMCVRIRQRSKTEPNGTVAAAAISLCCVLTTLRMITCCWACVCVYGLCVNETVWVFMYMCVCLPISSRVEKALALIVWCESEM